MQHIKESSQSVRVSGLYRARAACAKLRSINRHLIQASLVPHHSLLVQSPPLQLCAAAPTARIPPRHPTRSTSCHETRASPARRRSSNRPLSPTRAARRRNWLSSAQARSCAAQTSRPTYALRLQSAAPCHTPKMSLILRRNTTTLRSSPVEASSLPLRYHQN
jgi:hypothetical protein